MLVALDIVGKADTNRIALGRRIEDTGLYVVP
jgi:hypothetical protein